MARASFQPEEVVVNYGTNESFNEKFCDECLSLE
jgi:hypothetical protein